MKGWASNRKDSLRDTRTEVRCSAAEGVGGITHSHK
jgi:hypothetical protein